MLPGPCLSSAASFSPLSSHSPPQLLSYLSGIFKGLRENTLFGHKCNKIMTVLSRIIANLATFVGTGRTGRTSGKHSSSLSSFLSTDSSLSSPRTPKSPSPLQHSGLVCFAETESRFHRGLVRCHGNSISHDRLICQQQN